MAKNNRQKQKKPSNKQAPAAKSKGKPSNKQPSAKPTGKPSKCGTCDKLHSGECWNKSPPTRPIANCSHCGKKGHEEGVCYKKNPNRKPKTPPSTSKTDSRPEIDHVRREKAMTCQRERDQSVVTFPLTLVGVVPKLPRVPVTKYDIWMEDSDNDAIMCLHDCRGKFCLKRFAEECTGQLGQRHIVISQRDEEAIWQTMITHGVPASGFGESPSMDIDEVL